MPTGSLDSLSEIYASSDLVNCEPAIFVPGPTPGTGGLQHRQPTMALYHLVKQAVRNMRRLLVAFIDYSIAFESVNWNPWSNKAPWIQFRPSIIDFSSRTSAIILLDCWLHQGQ